MPASIFPGFGPFGQNLLNTRIRARAWLQLDYAPRQWRSARSLTVSNFPISGEIRLAQDAGSTRTLGVTNEVKTRMELQNVLYDLQGQMALLTINRAAKYNAISLATLADLNAAVDAAAQDDAVRVITITGAVGKAFASGSDLNEVLDRGLHQALEPLVQGLADKLERTPKPTIAAIDGVCMGGGLEVALGCDLRIATPKSTFATPEGRLGIIPGGGATVRLPRIVGRGWGMEMLLMGEAIDAQRALQIGLITRTTESAQLIAEARSMAAKMSSYAPMVPRTMKAMVHLGMNGSLASALMFEKYAQGALVQTQDKHEGITAFIEKREPKFTGK